MNTSPSIPDEAARRRTIAIISHPDAGKTTLTEKFLLYGGALHEAGSVVARKTGSATTSDWMEMEKQRGISVSSTVLQFDYRDCRVNLLDTPGHGDFSEDTYRVLTAVDSVVMVIDAGKGIEAQTRSLFQVCRRRSIPIITFINKLDRPSKPPLDLIGELESLLGIEAYPVTWPLGDGVRFRGVYDRTAKRVNLFERTRGGAYKAPVAVHDLNDPEVDSIVDDPELLEAIREELELLNEAGSELETARIHSGELTPVFFGSAANNFGVELLLDWLVKVAPGPAGRTAGGEWVDAGHPAFSAFVFKVQANMNPKHRDRMVYLRIVSGRFERDMTSIHTRTGKKIRLSNSQQLFARERVTVDEAWAGDVVGIVGNLPFEIGDTVADDPDLKFDPLPSFAPEHFAMAVNPKPSDYKRFRAGLEQLFREGVVQEFELANQMQRVPMIGAVGPLQFDVLKHRLEAEYNAEIRIEPCSWSIPRWLAKEGEFAQGADPPPCQTGSGFVFARDAKGYWLVIGASIWDLRRFTTLNPDWELHEYPDAESVRPAATVE